MQKYNLVRSSLIASSLTIIFIVIITLAGELYKVTGMDGKVVNPIKDFLKALHGHHWVGKGIWAIGLFLLATLIFYYVGRKHDDMHKLSSYITILIGTLISGTVLLYGFFTFEFIVSH